MDAFFKYLKQPNVLEDFKGIFDLSAKFRIPEPSEAQKSKYFQDEFNVIFQRFYHYLRGNNTLPGTTDKEVEHNLKKVDQSDLVIEFDQWLEQEAGQFTFNQKPKPVVQPTHSNYSVPPPQTNNNNKYPVTPTPVPPRQQQTKIINTTNPFNIERNPPPTLLPPSPAPTKNLPPIGHFQPVQPVQQAPPPQRQHQPSMQYMPAPLPKQEDKEKPLRLRFMEKLSEYMDCPQRQSIIKTELAYMMSKKGNN